MQNLGNVTSSARQRVDVNEVANIWKVDKSKLLRQDGGVGDVQTSSN